jgi:hypothetical protein
LGCQTAFDQSVRFGVLYDEGGARSPAVPKIICGGEGGIDMNRFGVHEKLKKYLTPEEKNENRFAILAS